MKKIITCGLLGGLIALVFIILFTNLFGVNPSTFYRDLIKDTFIQKYYLDVALIVLIALALILAYSKRNFD